MENKKLSETIRTLVNIRGENRLEVSDECLFDNAIKIFISNSIQESKSSHGEKRSDFSPSIKQFKILSGMGFSKEKINQMTKLEVSKLIGEYLNSLKKENI